LLNKQLCSKRSAAGSFSAGARRFGTGHQQINPPTIARAAAAAQLADCNLSLSLG
jgi:hypothetical protein